MALQPLASHRRDVRFGEPLPFGICDAEGRLLLAQGIAIQTEEQLEALLERGAFVDRSGRSTALDKVAKATAAELPGLWAQTVDRLCRLLRACVGHPHFVEALDAEADPLMALVRRDPDLALFRIVHLDAVRSRQYAGLHAVHTAIAGQLAAQQLGWSAAEQRCLVRAALTMNLAIVELQNLLANQEHPVSDRQRQQILSHPEQGAQMLRAAGVDDEEWLRAVAQHHAGDDGHGGTACTAPIAATAQLLGRADRFTARFASRALRPPMPADVAARSMYQSDPGQPMTAALIKVFGLHPPGTCVRLANGELGVVARRNGQASAVMVLVGRGGDPLITPVLRHTVAAGCGVAAVVAPAALRVSAPLDRLVAVVPR